ncbi:DNA mismatch repair endonuclease MutL [Lederbergia sp. NSJ-179]|uniref:DNA mismatch repair endonuclease MutL n=1 Tax=Lederbergia sp. NSJ-179 TaxID=2931402 RepID=UPI001FD1126E|nr:DNA mismatch repair endonuclease MutL [Lederbergia sp. NSJ-179]MCJ7841207.1 DNA mismatch repair endonuclease MutL [Lederbergia sp. NSJ-179]
MPEIIELDDILSNKIAAGEVVERPASVVKELVENAIDANSTIIEIDVEEAGLGKIRVLDNGDGIAEEDILRAFKRHATSKIKNENDLFRIRTLGFRGEALPSIASVSMIELVSAKAGKPGTKICLEAGKLVSQEKSSARVGTDLIVSDLFFNTPARLKYMKTIHTEIGHISDIVNRLALAHPEISFRLRHHERVLLQTNGSGDIRQVLAAIYGMNIARKMIPIEAQSLDFTLTGWVSLPEMTRASRNYISTMVNGRFIKNYSLVNAIMDGYHTLLPINRYPIVLLSIEMDPLLVDVNVHPAKMTVRLSKEMELHQLISTCIKKAFQQQSLIPAGNMTKNRSEQKTEQTTFVLEDSKPNKPLVPTPKKEISTDKRGLEQQILPSKEINNPYQSEEFNELQGFVAKEPVAPEPSSKEEKPKESTDRIPPLYPIGQLHGTYILAQNEHGFYMIDQHAAQERIKYEYFREKVGQVENELQELLVPLPLEFSADEYIKVQEHKEELEKVGIILEDFGMNSFIVRSHPNWFPKGYEKETIEDLIEQLLTMKKVDIKALLEEAAIMMSCKGSIKANHFLRQDEIQALLQELRQTEDPFTCPHGRPIMIHFSTYEIEKMFKRIM